MGNGDFMYPSSSDRQCATHRVAIPPPQPFFMSFKNSLKETFFPDDPLRQFKNKTPSRRFILGLQYFLPILEWAPRYSFQFLKSDLVAGITIASLAIPQGISYAKLANLPPILGLYSSFIPPLVYAMMGSSRDLAVGTVAVASLLTASMLGQEVNASQNPTLFLHLAFTATFFAGILQASLGLLRLGFIVDFLSHATIVGFMAGAATVVILQQLKGILGLDHFTHSTDIISVLHSVFSQIHQWRWESGVLGVGFLFFLLVTRYFSKRRPRQKLRFISYPFFFTFGRSQWHQRKTKLLLHHQSLQSLEVASKRRRSGARESKRRRSTIWCYSTKLLMISFSLKLLNTSSSLPRFSLIV